jgi:hypothetical protein
VPRVKGGRSVVSAICHMRQTPGPGSPPMSAAHFVPGEAMGSAHGLCRKPNLASPTEGRRCGHPLRFPVKTIRISQRFITPAKRGRPWCRLYLFHVLGPDYGLS